MQSLDSARILIADDHKAFGLTVAAIVRAALTPHVTVVQSVEAALIAADTQRLDMLITDLRFGTTLGGLDLIGRVRGHKRFDVQTLPILVLSANADLTTVKRAQALGVNDFLGKPVSPALLVQRLHAMNETCARAVQLPGVETALNI